MPTYDFTHPTNGRTVSITGPEPPDEATLDRIFAETGAGNRNTGGKSRDEIMNTPRSVQQDMQKQFVRGEGTALTRFKEALPSRKTVADFARPSLEAGGAVLGGIGGGLAAGPVGGLAGAGIGYATGKKATDLIEGKPAPSLGKAAVETTTDVITGAALEAGGHGVAALAGKGLTKLGKLRSAVRRNTPAVTDSGLKAKAAQTIEENSGTSPIYEKNAEEAAKLNILGYKPSLGEARNDPGLIKLQRGIAADSGKASNIILEQQAANQQAIKAHIDDAFPAKENIDNVVDALKAKESAVAAATRQAEGQAATAKAVLDPADSQTVGRNVVEEIEGASVPAKQKVNELYNALPNDPLPTSNTATTVKELKKGFRPGDEEVFPSRAIARVEESLQGPKPLTGGHGKPADPVILDANGQPMRETVDVTKSQVGFQDLHSLRKDLGRQIEDAMTGANPNRELAMKLRQLKDAVDADIEAGMGNSTVAEQYKEARQAFADYANRFRTGEVAKVTQRGNQASGLNIPAAQIPKRVFSPDGADDFIRAVGKEKAALHADQYAAQDLLSKANPLTGEIPAKSVAQWIQKNSQVLRKYGISAKYGTVAKAQAQAELARAAEVEFTKSAASRILNSDVDKAIASAFSSNPSNTGAVADDLIKMVGNDQQGMRGLQNAFKDFLVDKATTTAKTLEGDPLISPAAIQKTMAKYMPAMRRLYAKEPGKIAALQRVAKAVEIQSRSAKPPTGGPGTSENLNMSRSILGKVVDVAQGTNWAVRLGKLGLAKLNELNARQLNEIIARALYDPEFAQTLAMAAKRYKPQVVEKRINAHLVTLGLYAAKPDEGDSGNNFE